MTEPVLIRAATAADAEAMADMHIASWRAAYAGLLPTEYLAALDVSSRAERWREILTSATGSPTSAETAAWVAEDAGRITGLVSVGSAPEDRTVGELYAIYVHPDRWDTGIGSALHEAGLRSLRDRGCRMVQLWVLRGNERAIAFYLRHGWSRDGRERIDRQLPGVELDVVGFRRPL